MSIRCESCGFYGRSLCDVLVSCTVESYGRLSVVSVVLSHEEFSVSYGCLSVVIFECCHLHVCARGCSLVQRSLMEVFLLIVFCVVS